MAKLPNYYKVRVDGLNVKLEPIYEEIVEVVRCKDCKHFKETNGKDSGKPCGYGHCMKPFFIQMIVDADDFCSYGERKDNERKAD